MKRVPMIFFTSAIILASYLLSACNESANAPHKVAKEVEALLAKELQVGASKAQVITFLDSRKIEHSGNYSQTANRFEAIVRDIESKGFVSTSVQIQFEFDSKNRLIQYKAKEIYTGP